MDKKLEQAIKSVSELTQIRTSIMTVGAYFHHIPRSQEDEEGITKYAQNTLEELIHFARIEKLNDLNIIDEEEKEKLYIEYQEYRRLKKVMGHYIYEIIRAEHEEREANINIEEEKNVIERLKVLENKLNYLGIITEFNYEEAIMNQIDNEFKIKKLKK